MYFNFTQVNLISRENTQKVSIEVKNCMRWKIIFVAQYFFFLKDKEWRKIIQGIEFVKLFLKIYSSVVSKIVYWCSFIASYYLIIIFCGNKVFDFPRKTPKFDFHSHFRVTVLDQCMLGIINQKWPKVRSHFTKKPFS